MSLSFNQVYLLTNPKGDYLPVPMIALGVRKLPGPGPHTHYQFLVNSDAGHEILGDVLSDDEGVIEVLDAQRHGNDGRSQVIWRFEPLTLEAWDRIGAEGYVLDHEELRKGLRNDSDLIELYRDRFLHDWWSENP